MKFTFWEIAEVVEAQNNWNTWKDFEVKNIEFDTRKIESGDLFVPLKGSRDGHDFLDQAIERGAKATFWGKALPPVKQDFPYLMVQDPLLAMQKLATYYRNKVNPNTIAVTGSNGKTTTKDMVAAVLASQFKTYKTQGNYNNHIGLPYTILHMPIETEMLVLEMGMDHRGEIEELSKIAQPDLAAITMVGESHIEHLGSRQGIAEAKMEIVKGLKENGRLVIPGSESLLRPLVENLVLPVVTFGFDEQENVYPFHIRNEKKETFFQTNLFPNKVFRIPVSGTYNVFNACIAIFVGANYAVPVNQIAEGLENLQLTQNRTQWLTAFNGAEILSDVYNSNPTAVKLVLRNISSMNQNGKKIVVLADMLDLGEFSKKLHEELAEELDPNKIEEVVLFGKEMQNLAIALQEKYKEESIHWFDIKEKSEMMNWIKKSLNSEDMIMLKGSNGMKLNEVVEAITN